MPLVDLLNTPLLQEEMVCHLHPILCTWDALITCTPVIVYFPVGVWLCSKTKKIEGRTIQICSSRDKTFLLKLASELIGETLKFHIFLGMHASIPTIALSPGISLSLSPPPPPPPPPEGGDAWGQDFTYNRCSLSRPCPKFVVHIINCMLWFDMQTIISADYISQVHMLFNLEQE